MTDRNPMDGFTALAWLLGAVVVALLLLLARWVYREIRRQVAKRDPAMKALQSRVSQVRREIRRNSGTYTW